ncbi:MAG: hypothetical protein AAGC68_08895 [Verrucomicrobiota bacterium]
MSRADVLLETLRMNPRDWKARTDLAHLWRQEGLAFEDHDLLSGAVGSPKNRGDLQRLLDAFPGPPRTPSWAPVIDDYLRWNPGCPLGLVSLAHLQEASGDVDGAINLYDKAVGSDPSLSDPPLRCFVTEEESQPEDTEEESPKKLTEDSRFISLMVALGVHLVLIILFSFLAVSTAQRSAPQLVARLPAEAPKETQRSQRKVEPMAAASAATTQINSPTVQFDSPFALSPSITMTPSPIISESPFGPSMDLGDNSGGSVSFFGSQGKTRNLIYVVDVSGSMDDTENGKSRVELMKEELSRSVQALPLSVKFQIIFFSNTAWFVGQNPGEYKENLDPRNFPERTLVRATQSQKRKMIEMINEVTTGGGTNWRLPLKMAIHLEPDLIYFMTDGDVTSDSGDTPVVEDVLAFNREKGRSRINAICLMEPKAFDKLEELANGSKGTVFLVQEDGTVLRGLEIDRLK